PTPLPLPLHDALPISESPGADHSAPGAGAVRGDGGAAGPERGARHDIAITAGDEELLVGGADVEQVRTALAELGARGSRQRGPRSEEHTSELQSRFDL